MGKQKMPLAKRSHSCSVTRKRGGRSSNVTGAALKKPAGFKGKKESHRGKKKKRQLKANLTKNSTTAIRSRLPGKKKKKSIVPKPR